MPVLQTSGIVTVLILLACSPTQAPPAANPTVQAQATYEVQWTTLGIPKGRQTEAADEGGVLHLSIGEAPAERLRLRLISPR